MFSICQELGIDDPISWMNSVPPVLVDWWISFRIHRGEKEREAYESVKSGSSLSFDGNSIEASEYLGKIANGKGRSSRGTVLRGDPRP